MASGYFRFAFSRVPSLRHEQAADISGHAAVWVLYAEEERRVGGANDLPRKPEPAVVPELMASEDDHPPPSYHTSDSGGEHDVTPPEHRVCGFCNQGHVEGLEVSKCMACLLVWSSAALCSVGSIHTHVTPSPLRHESSKSCW